MLRTAHPYEHFRPQVEAVSARLAAIGEQGLSFPEFVVLRLYTGPLYVKYNSICRAASGLSFMVAACEELTLGNSYPCALNTLRAVCSAPEPAGGAPEPLRPRHCITRTRSAGYNQAG